MAAHGPVSSGCAGAVRCFSAGCGPVPQRSCYESRAMCRCGWCFAASSLMCCLEGRCKVELTMLLCVHISAAFILLTPLLLDLTRCVSSSV